MADSRHLLAAQYPELSMYHLQGFQPGPRRLHSGEHVWNCLKTHAAREH